MPKQWSRKILDLSLHQNAPNSFSAWGSCAIAQIPPYWWQWQWRMYMLSFQRGGIEFWSHTTNYLQNCHIHTTQNTNMDSSAVFLLKLYLLTRFLCNPNTTLSQSIATQSVHLQIIQSLVSSADTAEACCCGGETEPRRSGDADDARDDSDDTEAERDLALSLALSLASLSDNTFARVFEPAAFSLWQT